MKKDGPSRPLVEGAALTGIYLILLAVTVYIPILGLIAFLALPLPFIYQTIRKGMRQGLLLAGVCLLLSWLAVPLPMVLFTLMTGSVGLVMGYYYQQKSSSFFPVLAGLLTYLANYTLYIFIAYFMTGANAFDYFQQAIESQLTASNSTRFAPVVEGDLDQLIDESISMLTQLLPGWLIISSIVLALLNHYAARKILTRFGLELDPLPPFRRWNLPKAVLYYYLVALFLLLFKIVEQGSRLYMPVLNFNFVLEILLLIQGLSLVAHVFYLKGINRLLLVIVGGLSFIPLIGSLIRVAGILDLGFNLKERLNHALRS